MLLKGIFLAMILNIQIVYSLNIKNLLFKSQLTRESTAISSGELAEGKQFFLKSLLQIFPHQRHRQELKIQSLTWYFL
jgi:hypothetical protein